MSRVSVRSPEEHRYTHRHDIRPAWSLGEDYLQMTSVVFPRPWILTFFLLIVTMSTTSSQVIQGSIARCDREGEDVFISGISTDPCITCLCSEKEIICKQMKCPDNEGCHVIPYDKPADQCCEKCRGCSYKGKTYESGSQWSEKKDPCRILICQAGVVTSFVRRCQVTCKVPRLLTGQCCPVCQGCDIDGMTYAKGETFQSSVDPCITCSCVNRSITCQKDVCPVLNCPEGQQIMPPRSCCPQCEGSRQVYLPPGGACLFKRQVFQNGSTVLIDKCTTCICMRGTLQCQQTSCPILDCATNDTITSPASCCPRCQLSKRKCKLYGHKYAHGEVWKQDLCTHCMCRDGTARCQAETCTNLIECPINTKLKMRPGRCCPQCVDDGALCTVFGDPHYRSFDGRIYNFQGTCDYVLTKTCKTGDLTVIVRNDARLTDQFAWTKSVRIHIGGSKIYLLQKNRVKLNKKRVNLPYVHRNGKFSIVAVGRSVALKTTSGAKVTWDGDSYVEVYVPPELKNNMCGLCGNYNNEKSDDFLGGDGILHLDAEEFGTSWLVAGKRCKVNTVNAARHRDSPCLYDSVKRKRAETECAHIFNPQYEQCQLKGDVHSYYSSCLTDVCECPEDKHCFCESILAFTRACAQEGLDLQQHLPVVCKAANCAKGAHWSQCACPRTCDTTQNYTCTEPCVPGCECPANKVLHNNKCTRPSACHHDAALSEHEEKRLKKKDRKRKDKKRKDKQKKLPFEYLLES